MKLRTACWIAVATVSALALSWGCGGGGVDEAVSGIEQDVSSEQQGVLFNLRDGAYIESGTSAVYFAPMDAEGSVRAVVTGSGASSQDPLVVKLTALDSDGAEKSTGLPQDNLTSFITINGSTPMTPGTYGQIYSVNVDGTSYQCSGVSSAGGTIVSGAIMGIGGTQYTGCVRIEPFDSFEANYYIDEDSVSVLVDDLFANILPGPPLCLDSDCGTFAEPVDMPRLLAAYSYSAINWPLPMGLLREYDLFRTGFFVHETRRDAYENMFKELFTQRNLWRDYEDEINSFSENDVGFGQLIDAITEAIKLAEGATEAGDLLLHFSPAMVDVIKESILNWPKYANNRYVLDRASGFLAALQLELGAALAVEEAAFKWTLYQALAAGICEAQIAAFEEKIIPDVKDPALKEAFYNVKRALLGADPGTREGGILYDDLARLTAVSVDAAFEIGRLGFEFLVDIALTEGLVATGIGAAAAAAYGFPPTAIPAVLATVVLAGMEDQFAFDLERKIVIGQATMMYNEYEAFDLFEDACPSTEERSVDLAAAQVMLYSARLYFSLLHNSYGRWLISGQLLLDDIPAAIMELLGFSSEEHLWTDARRLELERLGDVYGPKAVRGLELLMTCGDDSEEGGDPEDPPPCTDECAAGQTQCAGGKVYTCIGGPEGCMVWDAGTACPTGICAADGLTCSGCTSHDHQACYSDDIYWYDSCNMREDMLTDCGVDQWTGTPFCQSNDVYQSYIDRGCLSASCTQSTTNKKKEECDLAGCLNGACCESHASYKCYSDDVYWYSSCNNREDKKQECGTDGYVGSPYCQSGDVYQSYANYGCSGSSCTSSTTAKLKTDCGTLNCDPDTGACCINHSYKQCYGGDVYWYTSCDAKQDMYKDCHATQTCSNATCVCPSSTPWTSNSLSAVKVTGGIQLTWTAAPSSWIHHYEPARAPGSTTPPPGWAIGSTTGTSFKDTSGTPGQTYNYIVYGYDACGVNRNTSQIVNITY
ncbi:MAG: hypothetical protein JXA24_07395 [Proteobacteria bacterium]|nr:hypothetical protein [Pseudomonadota bacterium]